MIKNLSHVSLSTRNINKVINFYVKILKMKIAHKFKNKNNKIYGLFLYCGKRTFLEFFLTKNKNTKFRHVCFEVKNLYEIKNKLKKFDKKIKIRRGKTDRIMQFITTDFEGNEIEFHQHDKKSKLKKFL